MDLRQRLLTFTVIGAGPTGVELAGQLAELAGRTLKGEFRSIDPTAVRVILLDAAPAVLAPMGANLGAKAQARLRQLGVEIQLGATVVDVDVDGLMVRYSDGAMGRIESACKVWSAGVSASPLARLIAQQAGAEVDRAGRLVVLPDLTVPGHPNVFVVGDMAAVPGVPGMAQGAMQGAKYAARAIRADLLGHCPPLQGPFHCVEPRKRPSGLMPSLPNALALRKMPTPAGLGALAITVKPPPVTAPETSAYLSSSGMPPTSEPR